MTLFWTNFQLKSTFLFWFTTMYLSSFTIKRFCLVSQRSFEVAITSLWSSFMINFWRKTSSKMLFFVFFHAALLFVLIFRFSEKFRSYHATFQNKHMWGKLRLWQKKWFFLLQNVFDKIDCQEFTSKNHSRKITNFVQCSWNSQRRPTKIH